MKAGVLTPKTGTFPTTRRPEYLRFQPGQGVTEPVCLKRSPWLTLAPPSPCVAFGFQPREPPCSWPPFAPPSRRTRHLLLYSVSASVFCHSPECHHLVGNASPRKGKFSHERTFLTIEKGSDSLLFNLEHQNYISVTQILKNFSRSWAQPWDVICSPILSALCLHLQLTRSPRLCPGHRPAS